MVLKYWKKEQSMLLEIRSIFQYLGAFDVDIFLIIRLGLEGGAIASVIKCTSAMLSSMSLYTFQLNRSSELIDPHSNPSTPSPIVTWTRRHILSLADFTPSEYDTVLQTAACFKEVLSRPVKKVPTLQGRVVANLFFESSTRTRSSFELAAKRLSADTLNFRRCNFFHDEGGNNFRYRQNLPRNGCRFDGNSHQQAEFPTPLQQKWTQWEPKLVF